MTLPFLDDEAPLATVSAIADAKRLSESFLRGLGLTDSQKGVVIPYGPQARRRIRRSIDGMTRFRWASGDSAVTAYGPYLPGHLGDVERSLPEGDLLIVEGESDCWTLWSHGYEAVGIPGAKQAAKLEPLHLTGVRRVFALREPDEGGGNFVIGVRERVAVLAPDVAAFHRVVGGEPPPITFFEVTLPEGVKDVSDLHISVDGDPDGFKAVLDKALAGATPRSLAPTPTDDGPAFPIVWGDDIESLPDPEYLIDGVIVRGSLVLDYGASGTYKSFVVLSMGAAVASGHDWQGRPVYQGNVVYVAAEGFGDLGLRHKALRIAIIVESLGGIGYVLEPVNLYTGAIDTGEADQLAEQIASYDPVLVIFDTLARSMAGGDENFAKDINSVIASADRLRHRTGATVIIIHHSGHDPKRERGSSALKAAADTVIKQTGGQLRATLKCDKMKMSAAFDTIYLQLATFGPSLAVVPGGAVTPLLSDDEAACIRLVPEEGIRYGDWKQAFVDAGYGSPATFNRRRNGLVETAIVEKRDMARGDRYFVTDKGKEALSSTSVN